MSDRTATSTEDVLVRAALGLAGEIGWREMDLASIAAASDVSLAEVIGRFPSKAAIITAFGRHVDLAMLSDGVPDDEETVRGRLFEILMRRFDRLQEDRGGVLALLKSLPEDPARAARRLCGLDRSMGLALTLAGVSPDGFRGRMRRKILGLTYLSILHRWSTDESEDMSLTMKALDKALSRLEELAGSFDGPFRIPSFSSPFRGGSRHEATDEDDAAGLAEES